MGDDSETYLYVRRSGTENQAIDNYDVSCFNKVPIGIVEPLTPKEGHEICMICGAQEPCKEMLTCQRCQDTCYCGAECQRTHWNVEHRYSCTENSESESDKRGL